MDNLDSLTNDELRLRLLECGFANMPVTVNTRKLLVKKLRNHLENEKSKLRRETIHVTKYSSDEDSSDVDSGKKKSSTTTTTTTTSKTSRRATIGVPSATNSTTTTSSSKTNVRRSGRITPNIENVTKDIGSSVPPSVPDILEDTDEEVVVTKPINSRRSKTPVILSKTEPVTISVRHIKPTLENVIEHEIVINDESEEEFMSPAQKSPAKPLPRKYSPVKNYSTVISSSSSSSTSRQKAIYGPEDDEYEYSSNINIPLSQSTKIYESNYLNNRNKSTSGVGSFQPRHSISTSYNNRYNSSSSAGGAKKFGSNEFGYSGITSTTYAKPKTFSQDDEEEEDEYEEPAIQEKKLEKDVLNSPYLSKFAKRLSELRVDPLIPSDTEPHTQSKIYYTQTDIEQPRNTGRYSTYAKPLSVQRGNITSRKSINSYKKDDKNSIFGQLRYEWNELNVKYKINRNLAILFILLVIIFIIVLLFF